MQRSSIVDRDFEAFTALAHPDMVYMHSNALADGVESYLDKCRAGHYVYHRLDHPVDSIRVLGDTVLVFGEMNGEITSYGVEKVLRNKVLVVWLNTDAGWKLLAHQPTAIPKV